MPKTEKTVSEQERAANGLNPAFSKTTEMSVSNLDINKEREFKRKQNKLKENQNF